MMNDLAKTPPLTVVSSIRSSLIIPTVGLDEVAKALPPVPYVVDALGLAPGAPICVAGFGFSRKTMAMQDLELSIGAGRPVWGVYAVKPGRSLHLDYEQGARVTFERFQRLARGKGIARLEDLGDVLRVGVLPAVYLDSAKAPDAYAATLDGFTFACIDSLRAATPSADENSSEIRRHIDILTRASERTGCTVAFIHHARKPGENDRGGAKMAIRGSSAIFDACSSVFVFSGEKGAPTRVSHEKDRNRGTTIDDFGLDTEDVTIDGDPRAGLRVLHLDGPQLLGDREIDGRSPKFDKLKASALAVVAADTDLTSPTAISRRMLGGAKQDRLEAIRELIERGQLVQPGGPRSAFRVAAV